MSSLSEFEKRYFENILGMQTGWVLDFSNPSIDRFFKKFNIDIHSPRYQTYGPSKAKKMRSFWDQEDDLLVGNVLSALLESYEAECMLSDKEVNTPVLNKCKSTIARLTNATEKGPSKTNPDFLTKEFEVPNLNKLPIESSLISIIERRLDEAFKALEAGAHLSVIFLCGSILEAVLLGKAQSDPKLYNSCSASPKRDGKVKPFNDWTLANLIDVSTQVGVIEPDIQKFGHGLRDFRNYIHPYQQMMSGFAPDSHTAKVCFQVLKAALASVAGER